MRGGREGGNRARDRERREEETSPGVAVGRRRRRGRDRNRRRKRRKGDGRGEKEEEEEETEEGQLCAREKGTEEDAAWLSLSFLLLSVLRPSPSLSLLYYVHYFPGSLSLGPQF